MSVLPPPLFAPTIYTPALVPSTPAIWIAPPRDLPTEDVATPRARGRGPGPLSAMLAAEGVRLHASEPSTPRPSPTQPGELLSIPRRPATAPHVPLLGSPLRREWAPAPPLTGYNLLQLGDARFVAENSPTRAVYYWLAAAREDEQDRLASCELLMPKIAAGNVALNLFHLAHLVPRTRQAQAALRGAVTRDSSTLALLAALLQAASCDASLSGVQKRLERNFAALLPAAVSLQKQMFTSLQAGAWYPARAFAAELVHALPHLLAPRCVHFLCDTRAGGNLKAQGAFGETFNPTYAAGDVLRFVLGLDADGHWQAMGVLNDEAHRWVWRGFLEQFFAIAPAMFVGHLAAGETPQQVPASSRKLCGLAWTEALALPLPRMWHKHVARIQADRLHDVLAVGQTGLVEQTA